MLLTNISLQMATILWHERQFWSSHFSFLGITRVLSLSGHILGLGDEEVHELTKLSKFAIRATSLHHL